MQIITPYFLPDPPLISARNLAVLRGVQVDILLPARTNLRLVQWASQAMWWQVLKHDCRIWLTPPPFDHSKVMDHLANLTDLYGPRLTGSPEFKQAAE